MDEDDNNDNIYQVDVMVKAVEENGLQGPNLDSLRQIVSIHCNDFRSNLSSALPAFITPMRINLLKEAKPVKAFLRNYS